MPTYVKVTRAHPAGDGRPVVSYLRDAAQAEAGGQLVLRGVQVDEKGRPVPLPGRLRDIPLDQVSRVTPLAYHAVTGKLVTADEAARLRAQVPLSAPAGVVYLEVTSPERDEFGRVSFFLYWRDDHIPGAPEGMPPVRGQVFFGDEREKVTAILAEGRRVIRWPSLEEIAVPALEEARDAG